MKSFGELGLLYIALAIPLPAQLITPGTSGGGGSGTVTAVATTSPITGGTINTTGAIACPTCGVTGTGLNQFAATTSAQFLGVISNETGSGLVMGNDTPTILTPTIASFLNATHNHGNAAGGGTLAFGTAITNLSGDGTTSGSSVLAIQKVNGKTLTLPIGVAVGDPAGSALATGVLGYIVAPTACTITGWDIVVDSGTATVDVWKIATGTAKPTVANTITAAALPAISTGTAIHSTTLTAWTTTVTANDIIGFNLTTTSGPKYVTVDVQCAI